MIVRSKRGVLILQGLIIVVLGCLVGWAVEAWDLLPMSRLTDRVGVPVSFIFFGFVGLMVAVISVKDGWGHRVTFESEHLLIEGSLGTTRVAYDEIQEVRRISFYGAGIRLKPGAYWLAGFEGTPVNKQKMERLSTLTRDAYGCEIGLMSKTIDMGSDRFVEELRLRLGPEDGDQISTDS